MMIRNVVFDALCWMVQNETEASTERLEDLFAHKPADAQDELRDVLAVHGWIAEQGASLEVIENLRAARLDDATEAKILAYQPPTMRATFYDAHGTEVETVEGTAKEVTTAAARFMELHATDPDEDGAAAAPGRVEFAPC